MQVGTQMRHLISRYIEGSKSVPPVLKWLKTAHGASRIATYQAAHEKLYPELVDEVANPFIVL